MELLDGQAQKSAEDAAMTQKVDKTRTAVEQIKGADETI